ncbi:hypothetical protein BDR03DRAFT_701240 [Suillus americanus]|nr:hypothetical protein BDR03DRAFT_701240 [Suillus americanus]
MVHMSTTPCAVLCIIDSNQINMYSTLKSQTRGYGKYYLMHINDDSLKRLDIVTEKTPTCASCSTIASLVLPHAFETIEMDRSNIILFQTRSGQGYMRNSHSTAANEYHQLQISVDQRLYELQITWRNSPHKQPQKTRRAPYTVPIRFVSNR